MAGSIVDLVMDFDREMEIYLDNLPCVSAARLDLHVRAGSNIYVDSEALVVRKEAARYFDHYTGLGDSDARIDAGAYVIYTVENSKIARAIEDYWNRVREETAAGVGLAMPDF